MGIHINHFQVKKKCSTSRNLNSEEYYRISLEILNVFANYYIEQIMHRPLRVMRIHGLTNSIIENDRSKRKIHMPLLNTYW